MINAFTVGKRMNCLKKTAILAASVAAFSTAAVAGGMEEPVMEPEIIVEESTGSNQGWVIPVLLLAVLAAVAAD